jgi:glycine oxidase
MHTTNGKPLLQRHVYLHDGFITPRANSEMLLGATYHEEELPSENSRRHRDRIALQQFEKIIASNLTILPALAKCEVSKVWRNWRPAPPDNYPILGVFPDERRIVLANGFIGLGLTLAPAVAKAVSEHFSASNAEAFPNCFAPDRPKLTAA